VDDDDRRSLDGMTRSIKLRPWQKEAFEKFLTSDAPDFLAVATPGAGKTTFALTVARHQLAGRRGRKLIVVAPTAHLKVQWAHAADRFALHLEPEWSAVSGALPADMHGIVTTYQQVAANASALRRLTSGAFVVFDEIHHAGDDRAWGQTVREAFAPAERRLALSGTPFRSDTRAIPFVRYVLDEAAPDFEYGYGQALADGRVVRPVYFPRTNGQMEWSAPDGSLHEATFDDQLDPARSSQRLRTALSVRGEWLPAVLRSAVDRLADIRRSHPDAGGLVIATDVEHAREITMLLADRFGVRATIVTSDDPTASAAIARFAASADPWLVAVRMVSEGVDIPRLRVAVYATTTTTEMFFRQAVGRLVRWQPGVRDQRSYVFIPDDPRLRARAFQIADLRRHSLRRRGDAETERLAEDRGSSHAVPLDTGEEEQLSLFAALSAVATGSQVHAPFDGDQTDWFDSPDRSHDEDPSLVLDLAPPPPLGGRSDESSGDPVGRIRGEEKKRLRERNADAVQALVHRTGWSHAQVNAELNRLAGVGRVTEATVTQLRRRLDAAERWLTGRLGAADATRR